MIVRTFLVLFASVLFRQCSVTFTMDLPPQSGEWVTLTPDPTPTQEAPTPEPTATPVSINVACNREISGGGLNIRAEKSTTATITGQLTLNECAQIVYTGTDSSAREWLWVCVQTAAGECSTGRQGWLAGFARISRETWGG